MAALTAQDKLALAMTSAGSMRNLAAVIGVTHQKIGRWLREGQPGGVKSIPSDAGTKSAINLVFQIHKDLARQQARADNLPFNAAAPVFMERKPLRTGQKGDRVFAEHTQFLRHELRNSVVYGAHQSKQFIHVSARSTIDLYQYARSQAVIEIAKGGSPFSVKKLAGFIADAIEGKRKRLISEIQPHPLFTQYTAIYPGSDGRNAVRELNYKLREKHEPATTEKGTVLADQLLFQLVPQRQRDKQTQRPTKASRRYIRGRGNK
jgi:hypothetical protein